MGSVPLSKLDQRIVNYADWLIRFRWLVLLLSLLVASAVTYGGIKLTQSTDYRYFFSDANPQLLEFNDIEDTYSKADNIVFVFAAPKGENAFSPRMVKLQGEFTEAGWLLPYSTRVDSLTNFQRTEADGDDLLVDDLIPNPSDADTATLKNAKQYALQEPIILDRLIRNDLTHFGLSVTFELPEDPKAVPEVVTAARELLKEYNQNYPDVKTYMTGGVMINNAFSEAGLADATQLIPIMLVVVLLTVWFMTRSIAGIFATIFVIIISVLMGMGMGGYIGVQLTPPSMTAPILVMTLAIADCVHILLTLTVNMRGGSNKEAALKETLRLNFMPVLLTSVTTALGFLTINFSDSPPLQDLGNIVAAGVMGAFFLSVTLFPALLAILPVKTKQSDDSLGKAMGILAEFVIKRRTSLMLIVGGFSLFLCTLVPLNQGNDDFIKYFDDTIQFRTDTDYILENLTGMYTFTFSLDSGEENGVTDPEFLKKVEAFGEWFKTQPETIHVNTVVDIFKNLNRNMHGGDDAYYKIPESRELAAQYLLLYEFSLPYGLDLNNQINIDKSATRFIVTVEDINSIVTRDLSDRSTQWLHNNYPELESIPVSPNILFSYISERNINSMVTGMVAALIGISFLMILALRNLKIGLLSLIPNLLPMGMAFGLWGFFVGEINFSMAVVMGMTLGIVVDDTVHFLSKYLRARREQQLNSQDSVRYAFKNVGGALFTMSAVLIAGFAVLAQSHFLANSGMAKLTIIAIACALIADFFLLPPLLMLVDKKKLSK